MAKDLVQHFSAIVNGILGTAQSEVQSFDLGAASAGTFTLTLDGVETTPIAFDATAADVAAAINLAHGATVVVTSGGPLPGTSVVVAATGELGYRNLAALTIDATGLTGETVTIGTTTNGAPGTAVPLYRVGSEGAPIVVGPEDRISVGCVTLNANADGDLRLYASVDGAGASDWRTIARLQSVVASRTVTRTFDPPLPLPAGYKLWLSGSTILNTFIHGTIVRKGAG